MIILLRSIYDFRNRSCALFRLLHLNYLIDLRGEIQRLQFFDIRPFILSGIQILIVRFFLLRRTAYHSECSNL